MYILSRIELEQLVDEARRNSGSYETLNVSSKSRARAWRRSVVRSYLSRGTVRNYDTASSESDVA
jgi:hypothetical protein